MAEMASIPSGAPPIHGGGPAMGSRLHGNDGPAAAHPTIVIPTTAGIHGGGRRWVPVSTGTTGRRRRTPQSSFPQQRESTGIPTAGGGAGDGFPSPRERRAGGGRTPQSSFPQQRESTSSFPRRRESTAGGRRWVPVSTGTTGRRRAHPTIVIPTTAGIHGSSHIVIPATAGIHGGGPAMGSRLHGNDGPAAGAPHNRHSHNSGNPRESTGGAGAPQSSFPRRRESTGGGRRWVPVSTGTTGRRRGAPHNRHSRDGGNPRGGAAMGSRLHGNDGRRRRTPQSSFPRRRGSRDPGARPPPPSFTVGSLASRVESTRHSGPRAGIQGWGGQARWRAAAADTWSTSGRLQRLAPPTCPCRLFHRDPAVTSMRPCTAGLW